MGRREQAEREAFEQMLEGGGIPAARLPGLAATALLDPLRLVVAHMPGPLGYALRRFWFARKLASVGANCLFDVGLRITGAGNLSIGEYTWIDAYVSLGALFGPVKIGKRCHLAPFTIVHAGEEGVEIGDYVAVGAGTQIWGHSEVARDGKRMSGPMIPWRYKAFASARTVVERDAFLGAGCTILPGMTVGEGAVVGAGAVVTQDVKPWSIVFGVPARVVGRRKPVEMPEL